VSSVSRTLQAGLDPKGPIPGAFQQLRVDIGAATAELGKLAQAGESVVQKLADISACVCRDDDTACGADQGMSDAAFAVLASLKPVFNALSDQNDADAGSCSRQLAVWLKSKPAKGQLESLYASGQPALAMRYESLADPVHGDAPERFEHHRRVRLNQLLAFQQDVICTLRDPAPAIE
jgi:hypothetical protein